MECQYCKKECKNLNSLRQHEIRCKFNPNRIKVYHNSFDEYNKKKKNGEISGTNQYIKAKILGLPKPTISEETRNKLSIAGKLQVWDDERKLRHSKAMQLAVANHPNSYNASNINGRTPKIKYNDVILDGRWEVEFAKYLDSNNIKWEKPTIGIPYLWNNKKHLYYPDFYLPIYNYYIEVKGYQRERDLYKYKAVKNLIVIYKKDIYDIRLNKFNLFTLFSGEA